MSEETFCAAYRAENRQPGRLECRTTSLDVGRFQSARAWNDARVDRRWAEEKAKLHPIAARPSYPYVEEELRKVARDAIVSWEGNRYSVPWTYAGQPVWVRNRAGQVEVHYGGQRVAVHSRVSGKYHIVALPEHHQGISVPDASLASRLPYRCVRLHTAATTAQ
jgi:hypothetical protein